jgi:hypothetical protein
MTIGARSACACRWWGSGSASTVLMMAIGNLGDGEHRFFERLAETVLGVALAHVFGVLIPRLRGPIGRPAVPAEALDGD